MTHQQASSNSSPNQASRWSSDHESDSDDSLQPYDLAEEDDDGKEHSFALLQFCQDITLLCGSIACMQRLLCRVLWETFQTQWHFTTAVCRQGSTADFANSSIV